MSGLETELRAFDTILRGKSVPFPTETYATEEPDPSRVPAGTWPSSSIDEIRTWFDWVGPEASGNPTPPFFAGFRKHTWATSSAPSASLRVWFDVPDGIAVPWVRLATSDDKREIIYNTETSTVFALYRWELERFAEISQSLPELVRLWGEIIETRLDFDPQTLTWTTKDPDTDWSDPIWLAAGLV